jgi:predicted nucleic acid-binding protein
MTLKSLNNQKNGLVIADAGAIFSLAVIDQLEILNLLFDYIRISIAVWKEITLDKTTDYYPRIVKFFNDKTQQIKGFNHLSFLMDYGESECVILYQELNADFLLIDDRKARKIAENFGINCIGTIGVLSVARDKNIISELKPLFEALLKNKRFYSIELLNTILAKYKEEKIKQADYPISSKS